MKSTYLLALLGILIAGPAMAQDQIFRCGSEYTNNAKDAQVRGCKLVEGGNVTVIQSVRPAANPAPRASGNSSGAVGTPGQRVDSNDQRARDSDARAILESELKRAEARKADLAREYNNGEPEKMGPETRNYQKYLERVADMKSAMARNDADIEGIKREIARLPPRP